MFSDKELKIIIEAQDKASSTFKKVEERVKSLTQKTFNLLNPFSSLEKTLAVVGGTAGLGMLAKSFLDTASAFEQFNVRLQTVTGSMQAAKAAMGWIQTFTAQTPYELDEVTAAFIKLKNYGIDPTDGTLRILGDTASAMGKSLDDAVEALADAMTGEFERLKEFGIKASATADQVTLRFMKNGQQMAITVRNSAEEIKKALMEIFGDKFAGGMEKMSHTLRGMLSNLSDYWTQFKNEVMESGVFNYIKAVLEVVLEKIKKLKQTGKFDEWARRAGETIVNAFEGALTTLARVPLLIQESKYAILDLAHTVSKYSWLASLFAGAGSIVALRRGKIDTAVKLAGIATAGIELTKHQQDLLIEREKTAEKISELKQNITALGKLEEEIRNKYQELQKAQETAAQATQKFANAQKNVSNAVQSATSSIFQQTSALKVFQDKLKSVIDAIRWQQMSPEEKYAEVRSKLSDLFTKALSDNDVEAAKEYVETFQKYMNLLSQFEGKENVLAEFKSSLEDLRRWFGAGELSLSVETSGSDEAQAQMESVREEIESIENLLPIEISVIDKASKVVTQIKAEIEELKKAIGALKSREIEINVQIEGEDKLELLQSLTDKQVKVEVDGRALELLKKELEKLEDRAIQVSTNVSGMSDIERLKGIITSLPSSRKVTIEAEDKASEVIGAALELLQSLTDKQVKVEAKDEVSGVLEKIKKKFDELKEFTIDIKVRRHIEAIYEDIEKAIKRGQLDLSGGQVD